MMIGDYLTHPAANVFPEPGEAEFAELCEDIRSHGLREPIVRVRVDDAWAVLDGRTRLRACIATGVAPAWKEYTGTDYAEYVNTRGLMGIDEAAAGATTEIAYLYDAIPIVMGL